MSKYGARRTEYDGVMYDSKLEAEYARLLHIAVYAVDPSDRVDWVARQVPFFFPWGNSHRLDFIIGKGDGSVCLVEVKGYDTPLGKERRRVLEYFLGHKITVWNG